MSPAWRITRVNWQDQRESLMAVRHPVFIVEQRVPAELEPDRHDPLGWHLLARSPHGQPIGTGRLLADGHIGRVAVLAGWRGRGLGRALMAELIQLARQQGLHEVVLNAQTHALAFYQSLGFQAEGAQFLEAGIPHQTMRLSLMEEP